MYNISIFIFYFISIFILFLLYTNQNIPHIICRKERAVDVTINSVSFGINEDARREPSKVASYF